MQCEFFWEERGSRCINRLAIIISNFNGFQRTHDAREKLVDTVMCHRKKLNLIKITWLSQCTVLSCKSCLVTISTDSFEKLWKQFPKYFFPWNSSLGGRGQDLIKKMKDYYQLKSSITCWVKFKINPCTVLNSKISEQASGEGKLARRTAAASLFLQVFGSRWQHIETKKPALP